MLIEFILYCKDQKESRDFYADFLGKEPILDVPGMTEFKLSEEVKLGLMPEHGIATILTPALPHPSEARGIPRCELYMYVDDLESSCRRAEEAGAITVSALEDRDWGDRVAYFSDPDGHVIALAGRVRSEA